MAYKSKYTGSQIDGLLDQIGSGSSDSSGVELYGFRKYREDSNPYTRIQYIADNTNYAPACMDFATDTFYYGDWANAFFIKNCKPCMLNYDGTVAYYLDPDDYTKKADGTASDVADTSFGGNCMIEFPKIYTKRKTVGNWEYVWISNAKVDNDFHCYSNINHYGDEIDHFYYPAYKGSLISGKLRSISGQAPSNNNTTTQEVSYATANNPSGYNIWYTNIIADWMLIADLIRLIGKSTNIQEVFGYGHYTGGNSASDLISSGSMNSKGLFWGSKTIGYGIKLFGIENLLGNIWERVAGLIYNSNGYHVKMTWGTEDGSSTAGYNATGSGYINIPNSVITGTTRTPTKYGILNDYGFFPKTLDGSQTTYECDLSYYDNNQINYIILGGACGTGSVAGFGLSSNIASNVSAWNIGASPSCKPKAPAA